MTQKHITPAGPLPCCAAGHRARLMLDMRGPSAGGGHFVECCCRHTARHALPDTALAEWRRMSRPARNARKPAATAAETLADNVVQLDFGLVSPAMPRKSASRGAHGCR